MTVSRPKRRNSLRKRILQQFHDVTRLKYPCLIFRTLRIVCNFRGPVMRILIATDAWQPQVNGVVRTLTSLARAAATLGAEIEFLTPDGFPSAPLPTYPGLRIALPNRGEIARRIEAAAPEAIHIATEGPIGWAVRGYCLRHKLAFTTSYTTRFPEYVSVRTGIPDAVGYWVLRRFHDAGAMTMVATNSLREELAGQGLQQARLLDARRRHQPVQSGRAGRARFAAADLHDRRPRRGRKESRSVPLARSAGLQGRDRRRAAERRARAPLPGRRISSARRPARI